MINILSELSLWVENDCRKNILVKRIVDVLPRHPNAFLPHSSDPQSNHLPLHLLLLHLLHPISKLLHPPQFLPDFSQESKHSGPRWLLTFANLSDEPFPDLIINRNGLAFLKSAWINDIFIVYDEHGHYDGDNDHHHRKNLFNIIIRNHHKISIIIISSSS